MAIDLLGELREKLQRLFEAAEIAKFNKQERLEYEDTLKAYRDWFSVMETAEEKGRAEGIYAVAQNMKTLGLSMDTIIKSTGLSAEEIEKL